MSANLFIHLGNSPEALAQVLATSLKTTSPRDPMELIRVGIGQRGMARMVESVIALEFGVSSHIEMAFPTRLLFEIGHALGDGGEFNTNRERGIVWTPELLQWAVYAELQKAKITELGHDDVFSPLRTWLHRAQGGEVVPSRRVLMQLSAQLGRVFDAYNLDRPEWHEAWVKPDDSDQLPLFSGGAPTNIPDELRWQSTLWPSLQKRLKDSTPSPVELLHRILYADDAAKARLRARMPALHLFGMVHIHRLQSELIKAISSIIPVHIYSPSPTSAWWDDVRILTSREQGVSPLLTKFGQHTKYLHDSLTELGSSGSSRTVYTGHYVVPTGEHALAYIQRAVLAPDEATLAKFEPFEGDRSFAFHASHSSLRQVEVLHDAILERIARNPELEPSDFVVLCPQLPRFAPLIEAVFSTTKPWIPFRIEDRSLESANPVAQALVKLLEIAEERSSAPELLELLSLVPVRARFELDEEELDLVTSWLRRLDVRWGWNDEERTALGRPGTTTGTWEYALQRLALGVSMGRDAYGEAPYLRDVVAFADLHGRDAVLAGKFSRFVREIFAMLKSLTTSHTMNDWCELLIGDLQSPLPGEAGGLLGRLVKVTGSQSFLLSQVIRKIEELHAHAAATDILNQSIDASAFRAWLRTALASDAKISPTGRGAVSFAGLDASRFASTKVIFLLGMDDGSFPRPAQLPSWDIRQMNARGNDHSDRDEDLFAILQAITLAEEHFGIIWSSLDPSTSQEMPPALPVLELQRLIADQLTDGDAYIKARTTKHRMNPFSIESFIVPEDDANQRPENDEGENGGPENVQMRNLPFTYQAQWAKAARSSAGGADGDSAKHNAVLVDQSYRRGDSGFEGELNTTRLASRLSDPQRTFLRDASQVNVEPYETQLARDDAGEPNPLEKLSTYRALFRLAERSLRDGGAFNVDVIPEALFTRLRGEAPTRPGKLGRATLRQLIRGPLASTLEAASARLERGTPRLLRYRVGATTLFFRSDLEWRTDEGDFIRAFVLFRRLRYDALLEPWAQLCIDAATSGKVAQLKLVVLHDDAQILTLNVEPDEAKLWLETACELHKEAWTRVLALTRSSVRVLNDDPSKAVDELDKLNDAASADEVDADVARFFGKLQTKWPTSLKLGGPSEWEHAAMGYQRQWRPPILAQADRYDRELGPQLYALYAPAIQALANARASTAGTTEVAE